MALFLLAFLLGSVPFGILVARVFKVKNLRSQGSGNIGATNVTRVAGFWPAGAIAFALDFLKGALPVAAASIPQTWGMMDRLPWFSGFEQCDSAVWAVGLFAVLGHCYSPWLRFRGGKGVATGFGALMVLAPLPALIGFACFGILLFRTRTVSLSCITGLIAASVACVAVGPLGKHLWFEAAMVFVILIRHEENINALLEGRERTFG